MKDRKDNFHDRVLQENWQPEPDEQFAYETLRMSNPEADIDWDFSKKAPR